MKLLTTLGNRNRLRYMVGSSSPTNRAPLRRAGPWLLCCLLAPILAVRAQQAPTKLSQFDSRPWLEDFHQLLHEMATHYANLQWAVNDRHMNLPDLRKKTEDVLQNARSDTDARAAIESFLGSFGDGHLEIEWSADGSVPQSKPEADVCEHLGYHQRGKPGIDYSLLSELSPLASAEEKLFPGGLLKAKGRTFGLIRIGVFTEKGFPEICHQAIGRIGLVANTPCDEACANQVELKTADLLTAALTTRAEQLRHAGATAVLIDVTGNGGGSDWVDAPPRALSSKPLRDPRLSFVKSDHWTKQLEDTLRDIEADQNSGHEVDPVLRDAGLKVREAIAASKQPCDADQVWAASKPNCSVLASGLMFASGVLPYAAPGSLSGYKSRDELFYPARYAYTESTNRLPLYILVDKDTWSAAEYFAALLQDNHAATIVGELTGGAGCGYTNGGIPTQLKNSKAEVQMPDCVRLRADGSDEVNGVTPDVLIPWAKRDSAYQRVRKLMTALGNEAGQGKTAD
jgi:Peptidase family S41